MFVYVYGCFFEDCYFRVWSRGNYFNCGILWKWKIIDFVVVGYSLVGLGGLVYCSFLRDSSSVFSGLLGVGFLVFVWREGGVYLRGGIE